MFDPLIRPFRLLVFTVSLLVGPVLGAAAGSDSLLEVVIRRGDGGQQRSFHLKRLNKRFAAAGCAASIQWLAADEETTAAMDLEFSPAPLEIAARRLPEFQPLALARSIDDRDRVAGALLAHRSRAIDDLKILAGERVAFVSSHSWSGYRSLLDPLAGLGVIPGGDHAVFAGSHAATVAMLLHHEVAAAAVAAPLAAEWSRDGQLEIILKTTAIAASAWWIRRDRHAEWAEPCQKAIVSLSGKLMKPFPAWIGRFVAPP